MSAFGPLSYGPEGDPVPHYKLKVTKTGSGTGTVTGGSTAEPSTINCGSGSGCEHEYEEGAVVTLSQSAAAGSEFKGWTGCTSEEAGKCKVTMGAAKSVEAKFDLVPAPKFLLKVAKTGAGTGTVECDTGSGPKACAAEYPEGTEVILTQSPGLESEFREWGGACSGIGACEVTMSEAKSVTAFFAHAKQALSLSRSGNGTVSSKPKAIKCAAACSSAKAAFYKGTVVTLEAKAGTGGEFEGWAEGAGTCTGKTSPCTVTMSAAKSLTAAFKAGKAIVNPQALTLSKAGTGYGTVKATGLACEAACTQTKVAYFGGTEGPKAKAATLVTLTAVPALGSAFSGWAGCPVEEGSVCKVTMSSAKSVNAQFSLKPAKALSVSKSGYGTVSSKPKGIKCAAACSFASAALPEGTVVTLEAKAGTGGEFEGWAEGAGTCTGKTSPCTVTMSAAKSLTAAFKAGKAIVNPQALTLSKAGTGYGTVKATGLACEAACTQTKVAYFGGTEGPKAKAATLVTLTAVPALGSELAEWVNCPTPEGLVCKVSMSAAKSVTARFEE